MKKSILILFIFLDISCNHSEKRHYYIIQEGNGKIVYFSHGGKWSLGDSVQLTQNKNHKGIVLGELYSGAGIDTIMNYYSRLISN